MSNLDMHQLQRNKCPMYQFCRGRASTVLCLFYTLVPDNLVRDDAIPCQLFAKNDGSGEGYQGYDAVANMCVCDYNSITMVHQNQNRVGIGK